MGGVAAIVVAVVESVTVEAVVTGAAIGAVSSAITGGNVFQGALMGGFTGGLASGVQGVGGFSGMGDIYSGAGQAAGTGIGVGANPSLAQLGAGSGAGVGDLASGVAGTGIQAGMPGALNALGGTGIRLGSGALGAINGVNPAYQTAGGATTSSTGMSPSLPQGKISAQPNPSENNLNTAFSNSNISPSGIGTSNISPTGNISPNFSSSPTGLTPSGGSTSLSSGETQSLGTDFSPVSGTSAKGAGIDLGTGQSSSTGIQYGKESGAAQAGDIIKTPAADAASGAGGAPASSTGGGFVDSLKGQLKNNALTLGVNGLAMLSKPKLPQAVNAIGANAQLAGATGADLINKSNAGTVTSGQQASINLWVQQAKAQTKDYYAKQGLSGSSMEASAFANIDQQASAQTEQIIQQNLSAGLIALNASNTGNTAVANAQIANSTDVQKMMANLAQSMGQTQGQQKNQNQTA